MGILESVKHLFGFAPTSLPASAGLQTPAIPNSLGPPPAAQRRDQVITFVLEKLRPYQNEPDNAPTEIQLFVLCENQEEEDLYRVALWDKQPGKFQKELNRQLADNYIKLPPNWQLSYAFFRDRLPVSTYQQGNVGLSLPETNQTVGPGCRASLKTVVGQTEQALYVLDPEQKTQFYIGRGQTSRTTSGRVRTNDIVILAEDDPGFDPKTGAGNQTVSRDHATIQFDPAKRTYRLLVDPGGLPARGNKTKILHPDNTIERADIAGMTYPLHDGDQIELGGEVTLLFEQIP
ncbi:FHA domain-containing protein [Spirosoma sp. SC4-14]|uniref:FHA domain-containing protein n=1 Tax=Spirosoma sp. SC4-14 TaxID=3128900 RepID=UPI0030D570E6